MTDATSSPEDITLRDLKSADNERNRRILKSIRGKPDKKIYLEVDLHFRDGAEFHQPDLYSFDAMANFTFNWVFETPLISNINFMIPSTPLLYEMDEYTRVS